MNLIFEWDAKKARENVKKHKVSFEEAKTVFNDPYLLTFHEVPHSVNEDRFISIGTSFRLRILLVVHTEINEMSDTVIIRIISCRKATELERKTYEQDLRQ
jgi:hypothetical protein